MGEHLSFLSDFFLSFPLINCSLFFSPFLHFFSFFPFFFFFFSSFFFNVIHKFLPKKVYIITIFVANFELIILKQKLVGQMLCHINIFNFGNFNSFVSIPPFRKIQIFTVFGRGKIFFSMPPCLYFSYSALQ